MLNPTCHTSSQHGLRWRVTGLVATVFAFLAASTVLAGALPQHAELSIRNAAGRTIPLTVVYRPDVPPKLVTVLSHGTFSSGKRYDRIAEYWADHGIVVILPDHRDANFSEVPRSVDDMLEIIVSRVADVTEVAEQLAVVANELPGLSVPLDGLPLAVAGHSVGTQVALQVAGLQVKDPRDGHVSGYAEERFTAVVLLSDPGKMAMMPADTWRGGNRPTFMVTGPDDIGLMGDGKQRAAFQNEILPATAAVAPPRYLLTITGLDHQFGGLIHKQTEGPGDHVALELFNALSTAFLLECTGSGKVTEALSGGGLPARAALQHEGPDCLGYLARR